MKNIALALFALASLLCSCSRFLPSGELSQLLEYASKPLLMPLLAIFFAFSSVENIPRSWVYAALFFAWGGDMLLMFASANPQIPLLFLAGLGSFLLMQLIYWKLYISAKIASQKPSLLKKQPLLIVPVLLVAGLFYFFAFPNLSDVVMKVAVLLYAICLSGMVVLAMQRWQCCPQESFKAVLAGAILFMISDLAIGVNRFIIEFSGAGFFIMITYTIGQGLIIWGLSRHSVQ